MLKYSILVIILLSILCYAPVKLIVEGLLGVTIMVAIYLLVDIICLIKGKKDV